MKTNHFINILFTLLFPLLLTAQENTALACSDGIDNDGDGMIDCLDSDCANLPNNGCAVCTEGVSFADVLLEYVSGCTTTDAGPTGAIGVSDFNGTLGDQPEFVFLGEGGFIKLGFVNNILTNSGDNAQDLWVFEIGPAVESSDLALRPLDAFTTAQLQLLGIPDINADGYYEIGNIAGATSGFDIDLILPGYAAGLLQFDAIEIRDVLNQPCDGATPGADIDAVCALSSISIDCNGTINGTSVLDTCEECLQPDDPLFNQSCLDCAGIANGTAILDVCDECLEPDDPNFNQSCSDCAGTLFGTAILDDCEACLQPDDPLFNLTCNQDIYIPNVFSPNGDGINEKFQIYKSLETVAEIRTYNIFSRWGELIYKSNEFQFDNLSGWWDGTFKGKKVDQSVFVYYIEILFQDGTINVHQGDITIIR